MMKFFYKIIGLLFVIIIFQISIAALLQPKIKEIENLKLYLKNNYDVIYLGDSILKFTDPNDTDLSSVPQKLQLLTPELKIGDVSYPAYDLGMYEAILKYISHSDKKPKALILPISLRSFSPEWDRRPFYQFEKEKFLLTTHLPFASSLFRPLAILGAINVNSITESEFASSKVYYGTQQIGTVSDFENEEKFKNITKENVEAKYIFSYMEAISLEHRKIASLKNILKIAREENIKLYIYITPIDYKGGTKSVGKDFSTQTKANVSVICSIIESGGSKCLDWSFDFDSRYFSHSEYPSEHLNQNGRELLAQKVSKVILSDF